MTIYSGPGSAGLVYIIKNSIISNCYNTGDISAGGNCAGIVNSIENSIMNNCYNTGNVSCTGGPKGGIVLTAKNSTISNCYNTGMVNGSGVYGGGIVGESATNCKIINCYNIGEISANYNAGGIAQSISNSEMINCYNAGTVTATQGGFGAIAQSSTNNKLINCYYLNSSTPQGVYNQEDITGQVESKTEEEMQSEEFVKRLNFNKNSIDSGFTLLNWGYNLESYPILEQIEFKSGNELIIYNTKGTYNLAINKVDKDTKKKLAGAKFRLENTTSKLNLIGNIESNSEYKFSKYGVSGYQSDNYNVSDSVANAYFPIDLRGYEGTFNLRVNYSISSQSNADYGYATITTSRDVPAYNQNSYNINASHRFIYTSGSASNQTSSINLTGGQKYYLHIGYRKDGSTNTNNDRFYINSMNLTYSGEVKINADGIAKVKVPTGIYTVTETKAPLGYELNDSPQTVEIFNSSQVSELTFENTKEQSDFNRPNFILTKKDKVTDEIMPGVKFMVLDEQGNYVKDYIGTIVGEKEKIDGQEKYVVTTDENGQVKLKLNIGKYKLVEVQTLDGYALEDEQEFEITDKNIDYEISWKGEYVYTHYPWKNYIRATSDGGMIQTNMGTAKTIEAKDTVDNKEIQVSSDKGYVVKYNNNGKIEKLIQINGFTYGTEVYEDKEGNYIVLGAGTQIEIPAEDTVGGKTIRLDYTGTNIRSIILKLNKELKVMWATKIDSLYPSNTSINYISENENGDYIINFAYYSGNSILIPAEDTVSGEEINISKNNNSAFMEYTKDGKVKSAHQITPEIHSLMKKENGGYIAVGNGNIYEFDSEMSIVRQYSNNISGISTFGPCPYFVTKDEGFIMGGRLNNSITIAGENTASGEELAITADTYPSMVLIKYNKEFKVEWVTVHSDATVQQIKQDLDRNYIVLIQENNCLEISKYDAQGNIINKIQCDGGNTYMYTNNDNTQFIIQGNQLISYKFGTQDFTPVEINVTNQKAAKVIVHHYLEGTGEEFGNEPVILAEDEILEGKVPDEYTTSPNMKIEGYTLIRNEEGEYVIPENASGKYKEEEQQVYYYYNQKQIELVVHHYLEGTEDKVFLGRDEQGIDKFAEDEHYYYKEGDHYKTNPSEEVLKSYELVEIVGDEEKDIVKDEEVTYYYKIKKREIITKVEVPEDREAKGGSISGEGMTPYEIVDYGNESVEDIVITPDIGYRIKQIRLVSKDEEGNTKEGIIYGEKSTEEAEITYSKYDDRSLILSKFQNMTEDKEVIVIFEPDEGRLIVHHYIENSTEKIYDDQVTVGLVGQKVETMPVKVENYVVVQEPSDRNATITKETQEKIYYYQRQYKITTDVIEHDEKYKDGTIIQNVKGGSITNEDKDAHEYVLKGRFSKEEIKIDPIQLKEDDGDIIEEYEIVKVVIKDGKEDVVGKVYDFKDKIEPDGSLILKAGEDGIFPNMQSDKHIEVEFRKKTNVIVKYLEESTEKVLYKTEEDLEYEELQGYEGKEFETNRKVIPNYILADVAVTDENKQSMTTYDQLETDENSYVNGTMYADTIIVIYWYKRAPSGIIVRHIETNEKKEEIEISNTTLPGEAGLEKTTYRNKYDKFIPVDGPSNSNENVVLVGKDENVKTVTYAQDRTLEVWYYYEKQYDITTEVKPHEEAVINEETGEKETVLKDGGTISKSYETDENGNKVEVTYEKVLSRGDTAKEIEIKPDAGYKIKSVIKQKKVVKDGEETIKEEQVFIEDLVKEDKSVVLPEKFLIDVKNDYNIQVEFEKIPAKVIVNYKDVYTKETIFKDKLIEGFVNDKYSEPRADIEGYIPAVPEPENSKGTMTENTIIITYWYTKQFKITAEVKPHEEEIVDEETGEKEIKQVPGGTAIIGENLEKEVVLRGESNTQKIVMTPDYNYRIKEVTINGEIVDLEKIIEKVEDTIGSEDETSTDVSKGKIAIIKEQYFTDMQEDKHIVVEYEKIPAIVKVQYLEEGTEKVLYKTENGKEYEEILGFVNDKYETKEKDIEYYEFVKERYPENSEGVMTEKEIIVKYYYKPIPFNMKVEKEIESITLNGQNVEVADKNKAKVEIKYKDINETKLDVIYKIKVTNTEKIEGTAIIEEIIPEGFEFEIEESNARFDLETEELQKKYGLASKEFEEGELFDINSKLQDSELNKLFNKFNEKDNIKYILKTESLRSEETKEYRVHLRWKPDTENKGQKENVARIAKTENKAKFEETTLKDNEDKAVIEIKLEKTITDVINDIKEELTIIPKTGETNTIYIAVLLIAGASIVIMILKNKKSINK